MLHGKTNACGDETSARTCTRIDHTSRIGCVMDSHPAASSNDYQTWIFARSQCMRTLQVLHTRGLVGARHRKSLASLFRVRSLVRSQRPRHEPKLHIVYLSRSWRHAALEYRACFKATLRCDCGQKAPGERWTRRGETCEGNTVLTAGSPQKLTPGTLAKPIST